LELIDETGEVLTRLEFDASDDRGYGAGGYGR
jgi:hypothetical protein